MDRRDLLRGLLASGALSLLPRDSAAASTALEAMAGTLDQGVAFRTLSPAQQQLVSALCDRIIPATDTPGALAVRVPQFIDHMLTEWEGDSERTAFLRDLDQIDERARSLGSSSFVALPEPQKLSLMGELDGQRGDKSGAGAAFGRLKSLTVYGYFTAERVSRQVLRVQLFHNRYNGCARTLPDE